MAGGIAKSKKRFVVAKRFSFLDVFKLARIRSPEVNNPLLNTAIINNAAVMISKIFLKL